MKFYNDPDKSTEEFKKELLKETRERERKLAFEKLIDKIREANGKTFFLITYDFKDNNSKIKTELTKSYKFIDKMGKQSLPDTTLIWKGTVKDTRESCLNYFKKIVITIIKVEKLDTEFDKIIVVEILDPTIILEEVQEVKSQPSHNH